MSSTLALPKGPERGSVSRSNVRFRESLNLSTHFAFLKLLRVADPRSSVAFDFSTGATRLCPQ